jgi:hypothetical protein
VRGMAPIRARTALHWCPFDGDPEIGGAWICVGAAHEYRDISTARDDDSHGFFGSFVLEIFIETLSQHASVASNYIVLTRVVTRATVEDLRADPLLGDLVVVSRKVLFAYIEKKSRK